MSNDVIAALAARLPGRVVLPSASTYDAQRMLFNAVYDDVRPAAIVCAGSVDDVRAAIEVATRASASLIVRSGRHSFAGLSTGSDIVLDLSMMDRVDVDASARLATIGAGARMVAVTLALRGTGLALPSGTCPSVGIAGLTLGGGIGMLSRRYGLTCDSLRSLEAVLADGSIVRASADENPELFWAARGGGGGGVFGVVTSFDFDLHSVDMPFVEYELRWPWDQCARVFECWQGSMIAAPRASTGILRLSTAGPGAASPDIVINGITMGSPDVAARLVTALIGEVGSDPIHQTSRVTDYVGAEKDEFYPDMSIEHWAEQEEQPMSDLQRWGLSIKSDVMSSPWPSEAVDVIVEWIERRQRDPVLTQGDPGSNLGKVWFEAMGGAVADVEPTATAFPHRDALFNVQFQSRWDPSVSEEVREANQGWLRGFFDAMTSWRSGNSYINYTDEDPSVDASSYFGVNASRLRDIADQYDPDGVFTATKLDRGEPEGRRPLT